MVGSRKNLLLFAVRMESTNHRTLEYRYIGSVLPLSGKRNIPTLFPIYAGCRDTVSELSVNGSIGGIPEVSDNGATVSPDTGCNNGRFQYRLKKTSLTHKNKAYEKRTIVCCGKQSERRGWQIDHHSLARELSPLCKEPECGGHRLRCPSASLYRMRERDMQAVERNDSYRQLIVNQWERIKKKAYPIIGTTAEKARDAAGEVAENGDFDIIFIDLPGTVNSQGVFSTIVNMDYVLTPIIADRMVMQSSLSFSATVMEFVKKRKEIPLKDILFFWNRRDRRANTEVFDVFNRMMKELGLSVLDTVLPETCRYAKELFTSGKGYFRCTLLPPPAKLLKGSGLVELAEELVAKFKL